MKTSIDRSFDDVFLCVRSRLKDYLLKEYCRCPDTNNIDTSRFLDFFSLYLDSHTPTKSHTLYSSFDIRDAGFKIAPVDANIYPAGFNNICPIDIENSSPIVESYFSSIGFKPKRLLIFPEAHTKNHFYIDNLLALKSLFEKINIETRIGWVGHDQVLTNTSGVQVTAQAIQRDSDHGTISLNDGFMPEFVVLNNDCSAGLPDILLNLTIPVEPSPLLGWHSRRKHSFFNIYNSLAETLATECQIDPWHLQVDTAHVSDINFESQKSLDDMADAAAKILARTQTKYKEHSVTAQPKVFVKSASGTYGMGILVINDPNDLRTLNRREKNKMSVGKNALEVHDVIVQEGIPTRMGVDGASAEPVVYMIGSRLFGGFLRLNASRDNLDNLNSKGMVFEKLCMSDLRFGAERDVELELVYGAIAKLSQRALTREIDIALRR